MYILNRLRKSYVSHSRMCIKKSCRGGHNATTFSLNLPVPLPITSLLSFINYSTGSIQHVTITLCKNIFLRNIYSNIIRRHSIET